MAAGGLGKRAYLRRHHLDVTLSPELISNSYASNLGKGNSSIGRAVGGLTGGPTGGPAGELTGGRTGQPTGGMTGGLTGGPNVSTLFPFTPQQPRYHIVMATF